MIEAKDTGVLLGGGVIVRTTDNRGFTPEEISERAVERIIYVGQQTHPAIRDQAQAFKEHIRHVIVHYMKEAIKNDRATIAIRMKDAGHPELIKLLEN
jgi:hypothetical protein